MVFAGYPFRISLCRLISSAPLIGIANAHNRLKEQILEITRVTESKLEMTREPPTGTQATISWRTRRDYFETTGTWKSGTALFQLAGFMLGHTVRQFC